MVLSHAISDLWKLLRVTALNGARGAAKQSSVQQSFSHHL